MSRALTFTEFFKIRRRLRAGKRHLDIARELDLFVETVRKIAADPRYDVDPLPTIELPEDDPPPDYVAKKMHRCPGCGAMVYRWPCLACCMANSPRLPEAMPVDDDAEADAEDGDELGELLEEIELS